MSNPGEVAQEWISKARKALDNADEVHTLVTSCVKEGYTRDRIERLFTIVGVPGGHAARILDLAFPPK
jgi:hypothetical protein